MSACGTPPARWRHGQCLLPSGARPCPRAKPQIRIEAGRGPAQVFIPRTHKPGAEAEVDFGEVVILLRGPLVTAHLLAFRMSFSGKAVHELSPAGPDPEAGESSLRAALARVWLPGRACESRYDAATSGRGLCGFCRRLVSAAESPAADWLGTTPAAKGPSWGTVPAISSALSV